MAQKIIMPKLGESVIEGTITEWLVKEGDTVKEYEPLIRVSTDKVDTEIPSTASGTLLKIIFNEGKTVEAGTVLGWIGAPGEAVPEKSAAGESPEVLHTGEEQATRPNQTSGEKRLSDLGYISPIVSRLAATHKIDLTKVTGTGAGGRITKKDLEAYIESKGEKQLDTGNKEPWTPVGNGDLFHLTESETEALTQMTGKKGKTIPLDHMRESIAQHMVESKRSAPHVTTVMEADLIRVVQHKKENSSLMEQAGIRLTYLSYFVQAVASALRDHPLVNSSWTDNGLVIHSEINIGIAVSLSDGLIVPVLKNVDQYSLNGLAKEIQHLAETARKKQLKPDDVQDSTFTITNHGGTGSLFATPIINQPNAAILGVGAIKKRPVVLESDAIAVRPMAYLSLSFDHRILDGLQADQFLANIVNTLENWS